MKNTKLCFRCQTVKKTKEFHKDRTNKDGYSSSCAVCRNKKRNKKRQKQNDIPKDAEYLWPTAAIHQGLCPEKEKPEAIIHESPFESEECDISALCTQLRNQSHFSISFDKQGNIRLSLHGNPQRTYKGTDLQELLVKALAK